MVNNPLIKPISGGSTLGGVGWPAMRKCTPPKTNECRPEPTIGFQRDMSVFRGVFPKYSLLKMKISSLSHVSLPIQPIPPREGIDIQKATIFPTRIPSKNHPNDHLQMKLWKLWTFEFFPTLKKTFNLPSFLLTKIMKKGWLPQAGLPWNPPVSHLGSVGQGTNLLWLRCRNDINRNPSTWPRAPRHGLDWWDVGCHWVWPFVGFCLRLVLFFVGNRKINFSILCRYMYCVYNYIYIDMCTHWNTMDDELQLFHTTLWAQMYDIC